MRFIHCFYPVSIFLFAFTFPSFFGSNAPAVLTAGRGSSWSAVVDGKKISGTTSGGVAKTSLHEDATIDGLNFSLGYSDGKEGFQFLVNRTGKTALRDGDPTTVCNYRSADGSLYIVKSGSVTINSGSFRTVGSFSGTWKSAHYGKMPAGAPETVVITDGKFDLP